MAAHANGSTPHLNGDAERNGAPLAPARPMPQTDQEIVRLIGQHLLSIGLERSAALLMEESGLRLEHPAAATFRAHVLAGDWAKADHELRALHALLQADTALDPHCLTQQQLNNRLKKRSNEIRTNATGISYFLNCFPTKPLKLLTATP